MKSPLLAMLFLLPALPLLAQQPPTMEQRMAELERKVAALEQLLAGSQRTLPSASANTTSEGASPLQLASWDYRVARGDYSTGYEITLNLKNAGLKDIKLLDGSVTFKDLLGDTLYSIRISPDQEVKAGQIRVDKGKYDINRFMHQQARMAGMKKEDITAVLTIRKLVFSDNSIVEYNP